LKFPGKDSGVVRNTQFLFPQPVKKPSRAPLPRLPESELREPHANQDIQNSLGIVATDFEVFDVYGAAALCEKILHHGRTDFRYLIKDYRLGCRDRIRSAARAIFKGIPPSFWC
jgi:hypothetical protein